MKSKTLPSFWKAYEQLDENIKKQAGKSYKLWRRNPFHPSLHFKCVNQKENIWSLRISLGYRALSLFEEDLVVWFWVGKHDDYKRLIQKGI